MVNWRRALKCRGDRRGIRTQMVTAFTLIWLLMASTPAAPSGSIPRESPEFTVNETSGKQILLSSFQGKVVMITFLFLRSPKCLNLARTMNKLSAELGARGFQPLGIVFGPNADMPQATYFVDDFKLTYPVGFATPDKVDSYLARGPNEILNIPQVVLIDRAGMIRAQSGGKGGNPALENENSLRGLLTDLLNEQPPPTRKKALSSAHQPKS